MEARRDAGTGTGLGLSIFKHLVEMQGGAVYVKSTPGRGSIFGFILTFGLDRQAPGRSRHQKFLLAPVPVRPVNLFLVDDDGMNIFIALKYLEICDNIHVMAADNGEDALREFAKSDYDILLTDATMPIMDEYRFTAKVRNEFSAPKSGVPIVLLTAEAAPHEDLARAGIEACLLKPFTRDDLYKVIYEEMLRHQAVQIIH